MENKTQIQNNLINKVRKRKKGKKNQLKQAKYLNKHFSKNIG